MKIIGILLIIWAIIGFILSAMMFGDIGVSAIVGAVASLLAGIGFLVAGSK